MCVTPNVNFERFMTYHMHRVAIYTIKDSGSTQNLELKNFFLSCLK